MAPFGEREMTPEEPQGSGTKGPPEQAGSQQGTACSGNRTGINRVRLWTARTMSDQLAPRLACVSFPKMSRVERGLHGDRTPRVPTGGSHFLAAETRDPVKGEHFLLRIGDPTLVGTMGGRPAANGSGARRRGHRACVRAHQRCHKHRPRCHRLWRGADLQL